MLRALGGLHAERRVAARAAAAGDVVLALGLLGQREEALEHVVGPVDPRLRDVVAADAREAPLPVGGAELGDEGLEVKSRKGDWVPFTADADTIVVNIGDMLQRLTNHVYPSTTHRVVNPPGEKARQPRYSTPFFLHPNPDFLIDVLPSCVTADNPSRYPEPITAQGYLDERLREIKLK